MDEQRFSGYLNLIQQLLNCPSGTEAEQVLQENRELVDAELLQVMVAEAQKLAEEGEEQNAQWLMAMAESIAKAIGVGGETEADAARDRLQLLMQVLQATSDSRGDALAVYPLLQANLEKLDADFIQILRNWASQTLGAVEAEEARSIAADIGEFSNLVQQFPLGSRAINLEIGIAGYEIAMTVFSRDTSPEIWAMTQNNLGAAYSDRILGEKAQNLEEAITCYEAALEVRTREAFPQEWAGTQNNLGNAYRERISGEKAQNLEKAIACYEAALEVYTREALPQEWATLQYNLGTAYINRILGEKAQNLEKAIACCEAALEVRTREALPQEWAGTQNNLGLAYRNRILGEKAQNLEKAIACFQAALQVYTREAFPQDWARTQNNLGNAYYKRILGEKAQNLEKAIAYYEAALQVYTRSALPQEWATLQNNLGAAYSDRILGEKAQNLEEAIACYEAALQIYTREAFPQDWAGTQNNLGLAYRNRISGEKAQNLEKAIACYEAALEVYTREALPQEWAMTQNNLGAAYGDRILGEKAQNLEEAITCYEAALEVRTREAFPQEWAGTQNNLGNAYRERILGEKAQNLEKAIAYYQAALEVYTREAFPQDWARTQNNLGAAYSDRILGEKAQNLEQAIAGYQAALKVYTREALPQKWATLQNNLGAAYSNRILGEKAQNLEEAIACYREALQVTTREAFPQEWADTQNNLGLAYYKRILGEKAQNLEKAIACYQAALEVRTFEELTQEWATTQNNLGNAYNNRILGEKAQNLEQAIACYRAALEVRTRSAFPQNYAGTCFNLGLAYQKKNKWRDAYSVFAQAIDTVESIRGEIESGDEAKQKLAEKYNQLYIVMVETCLELQPYAEAVEYAERSKSRNLVELIAARDLYSKGEIPIEVRAQLKELKKKINQENRRLAAAPGDSDDTQVNQWRAKYNKLFPYTPISFAQIQSLLNADTAILEWYIFPGDCFRVFVITSQAEDEGVAVWTSSAEDLQNLVNWANDYLDAYYAPRNPKKTEAEQKQLPKIWQDSMASRLQDLAKILHIDEIIGLLPENIQKLVLIPHRYLHLFPIHALESKRQTAEGTEKTGCLLELFPGGVSYAPSCQLLHQARSKGNCDFFFGIQNPTDDLTWTQHELAAIEQAFPRSCVLPGKKATKSALLERLPDLEAAHCLHFSCHGAFNRLKPLESGLQLADAPLTLEDIFRHFNLTQCSLVTLSACETGVTDPFSDSDEYISLASGFMAAGSPSLAVSLWSVNEASAALLFVNFYDRLLSGSGKIALSLNQAQLWLRDATVRDLHDWVSACPLFPQDWQEELQEYFEDMGEDSREGWEATPYQSPSHWAAFCAVGLGEQQWSATLRKN